MSLHREMLIDGHFIGGPCDQGVGKLVIRSPWDGTVVGTAAEGGWSEANTALNSAAEAFRTWRFSEPVERQELLRRIAASVRDRAEELALLLTDEVGKPITWSRGEVVRLALTFDLAAVELDTWGRKGVDLAYDLRGSGYQAFVERVPIGPVLGVVPYNWPYNLAAHKIAPALAVGNTIVVKPSSLAPLSTLTLCRIIHEAGCPPGVVNAVVCPSQIAEKMALDARVAKVSFTGSPAVGWALKAKLPRKRVTLELGGDASAIVMPDADLDWTISRLVAGGYGYAGQICISIQHVRVHQSIYSEVKDRLAQATAVCPAGDPRNPNVVCGPLISDEAADRVFTWIGEAVSGGATLLAGGSRTGRVMAPTLLEDVPPTSKMACEEVFGPVLTVSSFETFDEALAQVNASRYGIHAGIFTRDDAIAEQAFRELEVGGVVIDDYPTLRFDALPYGGVKQSGFGREGVHYAMVEMTDPKSFVRRIG